MPLVCRHGGRYHLAHVHDITGLLKDGLGLCHSSTIRRTMPNC